VIFFAPNMGPLLAARAGTRPRASTGGAETQLFMLGVSLAQRGWRVAVAAFGGAELPADLEGVEIIRLPVAPRGRARSIVWRLRLAACLLRRLDATTLVQRGAGSVTGIIGALARLRRRRFVYSSATVIDFEYGRLESSRRAVRLFRWGFGLAHEIVVQSEEQAVLCRRAFGRESRVIPSLAEPAPPRTAEPEALLWIGRLAPYKRPSDFVELARRLDHIPFWMIATPSSLDTDLSARVARAAECPNLTQLPPSSRETLQSLIERAVAIVNTSEYEGMPNVFLEGWARGVPAMALHHDPDGVISRYGLGWYAEGDFERLVSAATEAWEQRGNQQRVAARCREYVTGRHGIATVTSQWEDALRGARPT
jgi:glycosyltransferase involved in cell wall biosynthesis